MVVMSDDGGIETCSEVETPPPSSTHSRTRDSVEGPPCFDEPWLNVLSLIENFSRIITRGKG